MQDLYSARSEAQERLEADLEDLREQVVKCAESERDYRMRLAVRMNAMHASGVAWTVCSDMARGDPEVAELRFRRDCDQGLLEACKEALNVHKRIHDDVVEDIRREWSNRYVD